VSAPVRRADRRYPVQALLFGAVDYAGLFPPAQLDMPGAVAEYASYLASDDRWALGWFVVPAARLEELAIAAGELIDPQARSLGEDRCWTLSVVFGGDVAADMDRVRAFEARHGDERDGWFAQVQAIELRAATPDAVHAAMRIVPDEFDRFVEIPLAGDVRGMVRAIGAEHASAKVRTGGTTADAFPSSDDIVRFLAACVAEDVPFKATAGLHHAVRGSYPLTYARDSAHGTMYGFLNIMLAAAFLGAGESDATARHVLEERDSSAFAFEDAAVSWRGRRLSVDQLVNSRNSAIRSFGSCSFREPIDDLASLGLL
jgi:hypothetical protein